MGIKEELIKNLGLNEGNFDSHWAKPELHVENIEGAWEYLKENYEDFSSVTLEDGWITLPYENQEYWDNLEA